MQWAPFKSMTRPIHLPDTFVGNQLRSAPEPVKNVWNMLQSDAAPRFLKAVVQHFADKGEPVDLLLDKDIDYM